MGSEFDLEGLVVPETVLITSPVEARSMSILSRLYKWPIHTFGRDQGPQAFDFLSAHVSEISMVVSDSQGCGEINRGGIETDHIQAGLARAIAPEAVTLIAACCDDPEGIYLRMKAGGLVDEVLFNVYGFEYMQRLVKAYDEVRQERDFRFFTGA